VIARRRLFTLDGLAWAGVEVDSIVWLVVVVRLRFPVAFAADGLALAGIDVDADDDDADADVDAKAMEDDVEA